MKFQPIGATAKNLIAECQKRDHGTNGNNGTNGKFKDFPFVP
jgi:hypothetical protein